jgi:exopolysaccharide production protein ExoQ
MAISRIQFVAASGTTNTRLPITIRVGEIIAWIGCFASLVPLLLIQYAEKASSEYAPMLVTLMFMAPWGVLILIQPNRVINDIFQNWPLMLLPTLALLSTAWSDYPSWTLRASLEFAATTVIGILAGRRIAPRTFLAALFSALVLAVILSVYLGKQSGGDSAAQMLGAVGSKNYLAFYISVLSLAAIGVLFDRSQLRIMRVCALTSLPVAPVALYLARSLDAIVAASGAVIATLMLLLICRLRPLNRITVLGIGSMIAVACGLLAAFYIEDLSAVLKLVGKDVTLTGRTLLWQMALYSIAQRPIAGVGYAAFWQVGNWGAENMWAHFGLINKTGFHFHNTYLQVTADLGLPGLGVFLANVIGTMRRAMATFLSAPTTVQIFAISTFLFLLIRFPVEVDLFFQFQLGTILMCVIWVWLEKPRPGWRRPTPPLKKNAASVRSPVGTDPVYG